MKVGITTDVIDESETHRGIPISMKCMLKRLAERGDPKRFELVHYREDDDEVYDLGFGERRIPTPDTPSPVLSKSVGNIRHGASVLDELDILHLSNPFLYEFPLVSRVDARTVVTMWDMAYYLEETKARPLDRPKAWGYQQLWKQLLPRYLDDIDQFIAISHGTQEEMAKYLGVSQEQVTVVHLGRDEDFRPVEFDREEAADIPTEPFILTDKPYPELFDIYKRLRERGVEQKLVVFSGRGYVDDEYVAELGLTEHVEFLGYIPKDTLVRLYNAADVYARLVYFTGFGIPTVEAMACGAPVVVSNADAAPEVVDDAGVLLDPHDHDAWVEALYKVLTDDEYRAELSQRGMERGRRFSWRKMAEETEAVYESLLD